MAEDSFGPTEKVRSLILVNYCLRETCYDGPKVIGGARADEKFGEKFGKNCL